MSAGVDNNLLRQASRLSSVLECLGHGGYVTAAGVGGKHPSRRLTIPTSLQGLTDSRTQREQPPRLLCLATRNEDHLGVPSKILPAHLEHFGRSHTAIENDHGDVMKRLFRYRKKFDGRLCIDDFRPPLLLQ